MLKYKIFMLYFFREKKKQNLLLDLDKCRPFKRSFALNDPFLPKVNFIQVILTYLLYLRARLKNTKDLQSRNSAEKKSKRTKYTLRQTEKRGLPYISFFQAHKCQTVIVAASLEVISTLKASKITTKRSLKTRSIIIISIS